MSRLIKKIEVPAGVRKEKLMCPNVVNIYEDRVECEGGQNNILFFKDFSGMKVFLASPFCAYASVRFLNSVNAGAMPVNGLAMMADHNRINFCSGAFSYAPANEFVNKLCEEIQKAYVAYNENATLAANSSNDKTSNLDELKKLKDLLDIGAITQREFDEMKKKLLDL